MEKENQKLEKRERLPRKERIKRRAKELKNKDSSKIAGYILLFLTIGFAVLVMIMGSIMGLLMTYQIMADQSMANIPPDYIEPLSGMRDHFIIYSTVTGTFGVLAGFASFSGVMALNGIYDRMEAIEKERKEKGGDKK